MTRRLFGCMAVMAAAALSPVRVGQAEPEWGVKAGIDVPADQTLLPAHPSIVSGHLRNGLRYAIVPTPRDRDALAMRLLVGAGTLHEQDHERGAASLATRLAIAAPTRSLKGLMALGVQPGDDISTLTTFDHSAVTLVLPRSGQRALGRGLAFFADITDGVSFQPTLLESERAQLLLEDRQQSDLTQRLTLSLVPRIAEGCRLSRRLPYGIAGDIGRLEQADLEKFIDRHFVPANMTLVIAGDLDPADTVLAIEAYFGELDDRAAPNRPETGLARLPVRQQVLVARDPELQSCVAEHLRLDAASPPVRTRSDYRAMLATELAATALSRRLAQMVDDEEAAFDDAEVTLDSRDSLVSRSFVSLLGAPALCSAIIEQLAMEVESAARYGFSERELGGARSALLTGAKRQIREESNWQALEALDTIAMPVYRTDTLLSSQQAYLLSRSLLPEIGAGEVTHALRQRLQGPGSALLVFLPKSSDLPSDEVVRAIARAALDRPAAPPERPGERQRASLFSNVPDSGRITEIASHPESGVITAHFENGVQVHHKRSAVNANEICVEVSICGGRIEEDHATHGLTLASTVVWERPATRDASGQAIADALLGSDIVLKGSIEEDRIALRLLMHPDDADLAMGLLRALLTEPLIEGATFERWRIKQAGEAELRAVSPIQGVNKALVDALYPADDVRHRPLESDEVRRMTIEEVQRWLDSLLARAPIEAAIVGDIDPAEAMELARLYLGSIPARRSAEPGIFASQRSVDPIMGAIDRRISMETPGDQGVILLGFRTHATGDHEDDAALHVAEELITQRLSAAVRAEHEQLAAEIRAVHYASPAFPDIGIFCVPVVCDPEHMEQISCVIEEQLDRFMLDGPDERELRLTAARLALDAQKQLQDPMMWSEWLATRELRSRSLDVLLKMPGRYQSIASDRVREVFGAFRRDSASGVRLVVLPAVDPPAGTMRVHQPAESGSAR